MLFRKTEHSDLTDIKKLVDEAFGLNYLSSQALSNHLSDPNCYSFCLSDNDIFVGFIFLTIFPLTSSNKYVLTEQEWFLTHFNDYKKIAIVEQIAIVNEYRGQKLSNQLLNKALGFIEKKCDVVISVCWLKGEITPMQKLLRKNNFNPLKTLTNYWQNDSLHKRYYCVICGNPPCKCSAEIYELKKPFTK
ncbi:MAG: GNAT family N-acetyltransferase [Flavobacteriales bacterium]